MKKTNFLFLFSFAFLIGGGIGERLFAQVMVNYGSIIYSANDTIFANGGISNFKDAAGTGVVGGTFRNSGYVYLTGDWTNTSGNAAFTDVVGTNGNSSITCFMVGGNQTIQGQDVTEFHNLDLEGTGVKQLNGVNAIIRDTLNLNDREFATGTNSAYVTNTSPAAIQLTSGYVSSLDGGTLVRSTNSPQVYLFPVGSSLGTQRYRPVEITPDDNAPSDFAVRLANTDATNEGYPINQKEPNITSVNPLYYHQITRPVGNSSASSITIYYDPASDGLAFGIGHWQEQPEWRNVPAALPVSGKFGLSALSTEHWDFTFPSPAFSLIRLLNECGELFVPNAFSPDNNGENDMECVYGRCIEKLYFAIYDRWGEKVFETTDLKQCWDGSYKGKQMNTAVFVYYLKATLTTGEEITKKGNISLLR